VVAPGFQLTVCGSPTKEWLEWLRSTDMPLTACQLAWRDGHHTTPLQPLATPPPAAPRRRPRRAPRPIDLVDTEEL